MGSLQLDVMKVVAMVGKQIGSMTYLSTEALAECSDHVVSAIHDAAKCAEIDCTQFNVVKVDDRLPPGRISLLSYTNLDDDACPSLQDSWTVAPETGHVAHRSYRRSSNPPILHRKELLLLADDPRREKFARLTRELEQRGLFQDAKRIGFKRQWEQRLAKHGIEIRDHQVLEVGTEITEPKTVGVERHKTAISRGKLSAPIQALARHGLLDEDRTILDFGCGRGDDIALLQAAGLNVSGWDPHYHPDAPLKEADVVNLGFVINVIENLSERVEAIQRAYTLARQCLAVAVIPAGRVSTYQLEKYGDGFLTSRGTFQKYFSQSEARELIEAATNSEALAVAPGIFFVFRDKVAEQRFLTARSRQARDISHLLSLAPPSSPAPLPHEQAFVEEHRELIDAFWERAIELGRLPVAEELVDEVREGIEQIFGSMRKVTRLAEQVHDPATLATACAARMEDMRVYFALNLFNQRKRYRELPSEMKQDIKTFFSSQTNAEHAGRELLFSLGEVETIYRACQEATDGGLGHLFDNHSLQLHANLIPRLPAALRVYVGCAEKLYGDINGDTVDLVKIHIHSGKLTVLRYDDFFGKPMPILLERVKIKLRGQDIDFFDHTNDEMPPALTMKSRYMAPDQLGYKKQKRFDESLERLLALDLSGYGPSAQELYAGFATAKIEVRGWEMVSTR